MLPLLLLLLLQLLLLQQLLGFGRGLGLGQLVGCRSAEAALMARQPSEAFMLWIMAGGFVWLVWVSVTPSHPLKGGRSVRGGWLGWVVGGVGRWLGSARRACGRARVLHAWRIREVGGGPGRSFSLSYRE